MKISDLGEFKLIGRFSKRFLNLPGGTLGIGDDCAVIPTAGESFLVAADMLIEDVHFLKNDISPQDLGYKALAVNLSDIAGMGGIPKYAVLSMALPSSTEVEWVDAFFDGFEKLAKEFDVALIGGDTTRSMNSIAINITILGQAKGQPIKLRSEAQPGDVICVTGNLGDSGAGLKAILEKLPIHSDAEYLIEQHHRPKLYVKEAQWLASHAEVHAMMDVSDGIDSDLHRIMERSRCGASIGLEKLPISKQLKNLATRLDWDLLEMAATAGEDYCLLLTVDHNHFEKLRLEYQRKFNTDLYPIGEITSQLDKLEYTLNGQYHSFSKKGFDHFK